MPVNERLDEAVVGWLVCIEGTQKGRDYRIKPYINYIGSSEEMNIRIVGDNSIKPVNHAAVTYYPKEGFYITPYEGKDTVQLNGEFINRPRLLIDYDEISMGRSRFVFRSFCNEDKKYPYSNISIKHEKGRNLSEDKGASAPIAGWFVCIEGAEMGMDCKIRLAVGTSEADVSSEAFKHVIIEYESSGIFYISHGEDGRSIIKLNKDELKVKDFLNDYDEIVIGSSRFIFRSLCNKYNFDWEI